MFWGEGAKCGGWDVAGDSQRSCKGNPVWASGDGFAGLYFWEGCLERQRCRDNVPQEIRQIPDLPLPQWYESHV